MNTTENNKLIAEFMGYIDNGDSEYLIHPETNFDHSINDKNWFKYNTSWDWLMPVIYRMRDHINADMGFEEYDDWRENFKQIDPYNYTLEQCYKEVVEFIKWYNENKYKS